MKGLRVKPQIFESVTLLFTNIWNFQQISEASTPHEVISVISQSIFCCLLYDDFSSDFSLFLKHIRMLDDLYKTFDSIIEGYQVYKVETVKDTYFVVMINQFINF